MRRFGVLVSMLLPFLVASLLGGCGSGSPGTAGGQNGQQTVQIPEGYPSDYAQVIEASKKEGSLLIYSNMAEYNWRPIIEAFNSRYPWIRVQTLDLGSGEVFERYYNERASGANTADLLVSGSPDGWLEFVKRGEVYEYESPEKANLPGWAVPRPGLYTVSTDPLLIVYNKKILPESLYPKSLGDLARLVAEHPDQFSGKITTYDVSEPFGYAANWAYVRDRGDETAWQTLETILPHVRPEKSAGPVVEKLTSGEYVAGYFISGIVLFSKLDQLGSILGWSYIGDGTPLFMRGIAIPKGAKNVNAAKLMLDFILSHEGQVALAKGYLTPYRPDVQSHEVPRSYQMILEEIGKDNIVMVNYDEKMISDRQEFQDRWNRALER